MRAVLVELTYIHHTLLQIILQQFTNVSGHKYKFFKLFRFSSGHILFRLQFAHNMYTCGILFTAEFNFAVGD